MFNRGFIASFITYPIEGPHQEHSNKRFKKDTLFKDREPQKPYPIREPPRSDATKQNVSETTLINVLIRRNILA